jgi:hypothetical protein
VTSAMRERSEGLLGFSGACKIPVNGHILMAMLFLAFQDIYSGCCTVAAHSWPLVLSFESCHLRVEKSTTRSDTLHPIVKV